MAWSAKSLCPAYVWQRFCKDTGLMSSFRFKTTRACPAASVAVDTKTFSSNRGASGSPAQLTAQEQKSNNLSRERWVVMKVCHNASFSSSTVVELDSSRCWSTSGLRVSSTRVQDGEDSNFVSGGKTQYKSRYLACVHQHRQTLHTSARRFQTNEDKSSVLEAGLMYNVIRLDCHGNLQPLELRSSQLGLHPRDLDLLSSSTFIPQRATISVQREKVLVRMENVRAIVFKDHVLLFDARHPRVSVEGAFSLPRRLKGRAGSGSGHRARDAFAKSMASHIKEVPADVLEPMPFHLRVMESLLDETSNFFHKKVDRLGLLVERMLQELTDDVSMGGLQKLLPLRRAVTEVEHDVRDAHEAMDQVIRSDEIVYTLCLINEDGRRGVQLSASDVQVHSEYEGSKSPAETEQHLGNLRQAAADMLLTYQREVDDAGSALEELRKGIEAAQEVWELGLDTTRNRIIRMNLYISIATFSIALSTLPAAFFGMNLVSGYEEHPTLFYWVVGAATGIPLLMLVGTALAFNVLPKIVDKRRAQDLSGLLDLLRHLDNVDDIVETVASEVAGRTVSASEFREILKSHPSTQLMRQRELDIIFRMFDRNRDGAIEADEQKRMHSATAGYKKKSAPQSARKV